MRKLTSMYAVITLQKYNEDPVAQSLSSSPTSFVFEGVPRVVLSLPLDRLPDLIQYAEQAGSGVEYTLTVGTNKVTLLTHAEILAMTVLGDSTDGVQHTDG